MEKVLEKIKSIRTEKGFSHDYMAIQMELSQVAYTKIENGNTKLTVERLYRIAEILKVDVSIILEIESKYQFLQTNNGQATGYLQKIDTFYQENKEVYEKLLQSKDDQIQLLKKLLNLNS